MKRQTLRTRCFTLLEVIVAMGVLAAALSCAGIGLLQALKKQRFQEAGSILQDKIATCQKLAFYDRQYLILECVLEKNALLCTAISEKPLPPHLRKMLKKPLREIDKVALDEEICERVRLLFSPGMGSSPQSSLTLFSKGGKTCHLSLQNSRLMPRPHNCTSPFPEEVQRALNK